MAEVTQKTTTSKITGTCEPCPKCGDGWLVIESERSHAFFGQFLPIPDLRKCENCKWQEEVRAS